MHRPVGQACEVISNDPVSDVRLYLPERGPEPIALWHLRCDLYLSISDGLLPLGVEACRADRGDSVAESVVAVDHAVERAGGCAGAVGGEVHREAMGDLLIGDGSGLVGERGDDVEALGIDERVLGGCGGPVEGTGSVPINLDLVVPDVRVKSFKVLIQD